MNYKPIIIVAGEPNSIFFEIFLKTIQNNKFKSPIILIGSKNLLNKQIKFLKSKIKIEDLNFKKKGLKKIQFNKINLFNVDYVQTKAFDKISSKSNKYINNCFEIAINLLKKQISNKLINGPISKKYFLKNKFSGITEYLAKKTNSKNVAMVIYNKSLSVSPLTTHIPIKYVTKKIKKSEIINKIKLINFFWKDKFKFYPKIALTGLNPHCETINSYSEDEKILKPSVKLLKELKFNVDGPFPADTLFLKNNRKKFDVIIGMYHDQVLTPIKTLFEYDAINITIGLPFIRVSPDHGPNESMIGRNISNPISLEKSIKFLDY
jgi:4-hydroxythreonine-4-phosphate dehydrogenase